VGVTVTVELNGAPVPVVLDDEALATIAAALPREPVTDEPDFYTIPEAAEFLCSKRQRVDDLLSAGKLTRYKDGARTLVSRAELLAYLNKNGGAR
jgi:excisionase family DNA binding protein